MIANLHTIAAPMLESLRNSERSFIRRALFGGTVLALSLREDGALTLDISGKLPLADDDCVAAAKAFGAPVDVEWKRTWSTVDPLCYATCEWKEEVP